MFNRKNVSNLKDKEINENDMDLIVGGYSVEENQSASNTATNSSTNSANTASGIMRELKETLSNRLQTVYKEKKSWKI